MFPALKIKLKFVVLHYLRFFARLQLQKFRPTIVGVTGSAGKTSTVNAIAAVLKDSQRLKSSHQLNSETGIPLSILGLAMTDYSIGDWLKILLLCPLKLLTNWQSYDVYLVEMGVDGPQPPKNMDYLLSIVNPKVGVFLNVTGAHSENFDNLVGAATPQDREFKIKTIIGQEKGRLIENLPADGCAIVNLDDANVTPTIGTVKGQLITIGFDPAATICIKQVEPSLAGTKIIFTYQGQTYPLNIPKVALPHSYGYTLAAALATGLFFGVSIKDALARLKTNYVLPPGRFNLLSGLNHSYILDSSYNASLIPMLEGLEVLSQIAPGRKIAILGDMNELGQVGPLAHEQVAQKARDICDHVYLVGNLMGRYAYPILQSKAVYCEHAKEAAAKIMASTRQDDTIFIKGSQNGIFLEFAVEKLLLNAADAKTKLCRRGAYWTAQRRLVGLD